jgi:hypothetical protein
MGAEKPATCDTLLLQVGHSLFPRDSTESVLSELPEASSDLMQTLQNWWLQGRILDRRQF